MAANGGGVKTNGNGNADQEKVILTPVAKGDDWTILQLDRKRVEAETLGRDAHVAGGAHKGLVVNRQLSNVADYGDPIPAQVHLDFNVFLVDQKTGKHSMENRLLKFWFKPEIDPEHQMWLAAEYFKELVNPETFPRDYVGFITRLMKLMQKTYTTIACLKIHLKQLPPPSVPPKPPIWRAEAESNKIEILTEESLLEMIERAFPNGLAFKDIAKCTLSSTAEIEDLLYILAHKRLIKQLDNGTWIRWSGANEDDSNLAPEAQTTFTIGKHMPTLAPWEQPTIAIITALFCEKIAVDAMMDHKETFVRYQTQGEGTVYTLGNIGPHRVVCTKLPAVGHDRAAMIAAGNTTTRLLGIFQRVEYVFVVGCGGAVPHYTSYQRHIRLGDIVASAPSHADTKHPYIYVFCDEAKKDPKAGTVTYATKSWRPPQQDLQMLAQQLQHINSSDPAFRPWKKFMDEGMERLVGHEMMSFERPPQETDKLYMAIGETDVIQVSHPQPNRATSVDDGEPESEDVDGVNTALPRIHLGPIGGGRAVIRDQTLRQDFATHYGCLAFDYEFDPVLESIFGNRKDHYMCIRGMSDYRDGMRNKEWQPYASLAAAAFMKAVIMTMQVQEPEMPAPPPAYSYSPQAQSHHHHQNRPYQPPVQVLPSSASPIQASHHRPPVINHSNGHHHQQLPRSYAAPAPEYSKPKGPSVVSAAGTPPQQARQSFV
ncbi:hypothetical protein BV898_15515 [Hypsibius exemplaris]|uniref:Winged helix-turn-helix domain-containing protein n=1 Tax=Hypsibius exemplaris TaxID=2072580 RepID=A0A9X6ND35_HYPEX|nr:hypothetical protein BV898_15515 [Hypsibius exemplaris]